MRDQETTTEVVMTRETTVTMTTEDQLKVREEVVVESPMVNKEREDLQEKPLDLTTEMTITETEETMRARDQEVEVEAVEAVRAPEVEAMVKEEEVAVVVIEATVETEVAKEVEAEEEVETEVAVMPQERSEMSKEMTEVENDLQCLAVRMIIN